MKALIAMVVVLASMLASGMASAQNGGMMHDGGMSGGGWMGGYWGPVLLVVAVGVVVWAVLQKRR